MSAPTALELTYEKNVEELSAWLGGGIACPSNSNGIAGILVAMRERGYIVRIEPQPRDQWLVKVEGHLGKSCSTAGDPDPNPIARLALAVVTACHQTLERQQR